MTNPLCKNINYIGVFLTFDCNMRCGYCINRFTNLAIRKEISAKKWLSILGEVPTREDLPITLQGGEPTQYPEFYELVNRLYKAEKKIDILTNGMFDVNEFCNKTDPAMFKRKAPYASIRFSYHETTPLQKLIATVFHLQEEGYSVGVWGLNHPSMRTKNFMARAQCRLLGIDFRLKEYLDETHGTYKYPDAITGLKNKLVMCKPSEKLYSPDGKLFPCHGLLYADNVKQYHPVGDIGLCSQYGRCNPCDVKLKTNRLQQKGHCSVEIMEVA